MDDRDDADDGSRGRSADAADESPTGTPETADGTEGGEEWQFSLEDIDQREADRAAADEAAARRREPLEPGDPSLEGILFVLLGMAVTVFALSRLFLP